MSDVYNRRWKTKTFEQFREDEVLPSWPTGRDVADLNLGIEFQQSLPDNLRFHKKLEHAVASNTVLSQPRAGVALLNEHITLLQQLRDKGGADLLPTTIDSYTRQNRYKEAEEGIRKSIQSGRSLLNGFPAVNHGLARCRQVVESQSVPVEVRHGTPDARLLAEITLAAGFTSFEGGGISYNIPYAKNVPMEKSILDWQYVDWLVGRYAEKGIIINREPFGALTGTLVPPSVSNAVAILEGIFAVIQGVVSITVGYGQCGNLYQDIAALRSLSEITSRYFDNEGFTGVHVSTVFHQWMGGFPVDPAKAYAVISWGSTVAALAGVTKVIVKTPDEALGVPTCAANINGLNTTRQILNMLTDQRVDDSHRLQTETDLINRETCCILEKVRELGNGDWVIGTIEAFKQGVLDIPFAPSRCNRGKVLPVRDLDGAVRFYDIGGLPFTSDIQEFHREKIQERATAEKREISFQMVTDDIYAISKGFLTGKPSHKTGNNSP